MTSATADDEDAERTVQQWPAAEREREDVDSSIGAASLAGTGPPQ